MKNKILIILFTILTTLLVLTMSINAEDPCTHENKVVSAVNYTDYAQKGTMLFTCPDCTATEMSISPLLYQSGYSVSEKGGQLCTTYNVNADAMSALKKLNASFEAGIVVASKNLLGDKLPLDAKTAAPIDLSAYGATVIKVSVENNKFSSIDLRLNDFTPDKYYQQLYMSAYVFDGSQVKYVQNSTNASAITSVCYLQATGNTEYVDKENPKYQYSLVKETKDADHRVGQMQSSAATYNKGAEDGVSSWDLLKYQGAATTIVLGGSIAGYTQAKNYLSHYLGGSGKQYTVDMDAFLKDSVALSVRNKDINRALRAAEHLAIEGAKVNMNQCEEQVNNVLSGDWYYAMGGYFSRINMTDLTCNEENGVKTYSTTLKYTVIDFYNWGTSGDKIFGLISQWQLLQLHKAGKAQDFLSYGEVSYTITWTEGQTVDQIAGLN